MAKRKRRTKRKTSSCAVKTVQGRRRRICRDRKGRITSNKAA